MSDIIKNVLYTHILVKFFVPSGMIEERLITLAKGVFSVHRQSASSSNIWTWVFGPQEAIYACHHQPDRQRPEQDFRHRLKPGVTHWGAKPS